MHARMHQKLIDQGIAAAELPECLCVTTHDITLHMWFETVSLGCFLIIVVWQIVGI